MLATNDCQNLMSPQKRNFCNYQVIPYQYCVLLCAIHTYASPPINMHYMAHRGGACMINMLIISVGTSICTFACRDGLRKIKYKQKAKWVTAKRWITVSRFQYGERWRNIVLLFLIREDKKKLIPLPQSSWWWRVRMPSPKTFWDLIKHFMPH